MAEFKIISPNNEVLPIQDNIYFDLIDIDGQTMFNSSISTVTIGGNDGATINTIAANPRSIIMTLRIKNGVDVEGAKRYIFRFIKPKQKHKIIWNRNQREIYIEGVCESASMPRWQNGITCQITFFCEQPFWEDVDTIVQEISNIIPLHYFTSDDEDMLYFDGESGGIVLGEYDTARTRNYYNSGDVDVGIEIVINALKTVTDPVIYMSPDIFIGVDDVILQAGEKITITTQKGYKDILKDGVSIIDKIRPGSTWLQMKTGNNTFTIDSSDETNDNMVFEIIYAQRYV